MYNVRSTYLLQHIVIVLAILELPSQLMAASESKKELHRYSEESLLRFWDNNYLDFWDRQTSTPNHIRLDNINRELQQALASDDEVSRDEQPRRRGVSTVGQSIGNGTQKVNHEFSVFLINPELRNKFKGRELALKMFLSRLHSYQGDKGNRSTLISEPLPPRLLALRARANLELLLGHFFDYQASALIHDKCNYLTKTKDYLEILKSMAGDSKLQDLKFMEVHPFDWAGGTVDQSVNTIQTAISSLYARGTPLICKVKPVVSRADIEIEIEKKVNCTFMNILNDSCDSDDTELSAGIVGKTIAEITGPDSVVGQAESRFSRLQGVQTYTEEAFTLDREVKILEQSIAFVRDDRLGLTSLVQELKGLDLKSIQDLSFRPQILTTVAEKSAEIDQQVTKVVRILKSIANKTSKDRPLTCLELKDTSKEISALTLSQCLTEIETYLEKNQDSVYDPDILEFSTYLGDMAKEI